MSYAKIVKNYDKSVFNKIHMLVDHVPQIIKRKKRSLGIFTEAIGEDIHGVFWPYFQKTKVKLPKYWPVEDPPPTAASEEFTLLGNKKLRAIAEAMLNSTSEFNADNLKDYSKK